MKNLILTLTAMISLFSNNVFAELNDPNGLLPELMSFIGERKFEEVYQVGDVATRADSTCFWIEGDKICNIDGAKRKVISVNHKKVVVQVTDLFTGETREEIIENETLIILPIGGKSFAQRSMNFNKIHYFDAVNASNELTIDSIKYFGDRASLRLSGQFCNEDRKCEDLKMFVTLNRAVNELSFIELLNLETESISVFSQLK